MVWVINLSCNETQACTPEIALYFKEIDTDHNGQISQDERYAYVNAQHFQSQS
jgi:hypothetical protein